MSNEICSGYCPRCKSLVVYDSDTGETSCVTCGWKESGQ